MATQAHTAYMPRTERFYAPRVATDRMSIVQVSPQLWGVTHEINEFVDRVSSGLSERGHQVVVAAPSGSRAAVRDPEGAATTT